MKTPAEKCAERIRAVSCNMYVPSETVMATIINEEYAETFKVAREAMERAEAIIDGRIPFLSSNRDEICTQLRTALDQLTK